MNRIISAEQVLAELLATLRRLDALEAPVAAAYLDSAIEALCRQYQLTREPSETD